ncbi:hypothetical protein CgunFtcFv8_027872 [Champsocephalus gunnari]|uniref:Uncharacterized protein n=1 Tax=Champsocephalus gunnari TaxID=52237 RepID=A0AAN8E7S5_CHAGU|nr:hypothetical protein CgunFtcFv8_027872 [Champsocephalus gunnari]
MAIGPKVVSHGVDALQAVAANPHHGYKGDTTAVKSANYRNISWICGRLLISLGNDSLKDYRGFKEDPRTKVAVEKIISDYITHEMGDDADMETDYTDDEIVGTQRAIPLCRDHLRR